MSESTADVIARLQERLRPHVASPATVTRKDTDSKPPADVSDDYGTRKNTNANRANGGGSCYYKPRAADYAGRLPPTTVPSAPNIKPANGIRVTGDVTVEDARVIGTDNAYRQWVATRTNLMQAAGDVLPAGEHYPSRITRRGNLAPSPRY